MPTGVALRDPRDQLFEAAERVLLRDGPRGLTSRAVTAEAGCAKGVLHRHFADFDAFLAELVLDRIRRLEAQAAGLLAAAGQGAVAEHLTDVLVAVFGPVGMAIVGLVAARDELRARLRQAGSAGVPLLGEATTVLAAYLAAERERGRIAAHADVDVLALTLIGSAHLLLAGPGDGPPGRAEVEKLVVSIIGGLLPAPDG